MSIMSLLPFICFFVGMLIGAPIAIALGGGALAFFLTAGGIPMEAFVQKMQAPFGSFPLVAIPLYVFAATVLNYAGVTRRLFDFAEALVGSSVGGMAKVNVVFATLTGGVSASATADAAMQAKVIGLPMLERGYPKAFVAVVIAASSIITPIIPPGIGFILYGAMTDTSIGQLFAAGILPGILICIVLIVTVHIVVKGRNFPWTNAEHERKAAVAATSVMRSFRRALLALLMPFIIVFGIRYGIFTPTEAGGLLALIGLVFGLVVYRELKPFHFPLILHETVAATASLMLIVCFSTAFAFYLTWEGIPQQIMRVVTSTVTDPYLLLLLVNIVLLIAGLFLDTVSALIILVPIILPIAIKAGIDPVHLGVIVVLNLTFGAMTPPVGTLMYLVNSILNVTVMQFTKAAAPFFAAYLVLLTIISYVPKISLLLPRAMF
ncbi:MAG: TRAP transporter large permease [Betaproteobacteria bacterium]|nr:TRAP transporter large permease [Betaproteobacteria bacterium]